jgi:peroxiredoxin
MFEQTKRLSLLSRNAYPPDVTRAIEWHISRCRAAIRFGHSYQPKETASTFTLTDGRGTRVSSDALLCHGPLVVQFYRGTWCPYANAELEQLSRFYSSILAARASLVVVTPQTADSARPYREQHPVPFPVLVDTEFSITNAFCVVDDFPENVKNVYRHGLGIDIATINADGSWRLPFGSRFIIDSDDSIVAASVDPDYRYAESAEQTLRNVERMWPLPRRQFPTEAQL